MDSKPKFYDWGVGMMENALQLSIGEETKELRIKEYNGQRVVTLNEIDELHNRPEGTARKAFNRNKKHFALNEDYFVSLKDEASELGFIAPRGLILLTETGYLMIVKPFTDDLSWQVQRMLVNSYFKMQQQITPQGQPIAPANQFEFLHKLLEAVEDAYNKADAALTRTNQIEGQVIDITHRINNLDNVDTIGDPQQRLVSMIRKYALQEGIKYEFAWGRFVKAFNTAYEVNLKSRRTRYQNENGKKLTIPELLEQLGWLEDGIRVADKMLNNPQTDK